jgi:hypothetical protein
VRQGAATARCPHQPLDLVVLTLIPGAAGLSAANATARAMVHGLADTTSREA